MKHFDFHFVCRMLAGTSPRRLLSLHGNESQKQHSYALDCSTVPTAFPLIEKWFIHCQIKTSDVWELGGKYLPLFITCIHISIVYVIGWCFCEFCGPAVFCMHIYGRPLKIINRLPWEVIQITTTYLIVLAQKTADSGTVMARHFGVSLRDSMTWKKTG